MSLRDESSWDFGEISSENVFWVKRGTKEANRDIWKTVIIYLLKTENPLISQVSYSRSYLWNGLWSIGSVSWEASSCKRVARESWNSLCKILEKLKMASSFSCVSSYSWLTCENVFEGVFQQKQNGLFGKTFNTKILHKNTFKNI